MISTAEEFRGQERARLLLGAYLAKDRLAGTFLILGQRGLGKTTLGTILARALTCESNQAPQRLHFCGECYACRSIAAREQPEHVMVRPKTKQITIEMIEEEHQGFSSASLHPTLLSHRVFHIVDAHYLNLQSSNQLLKLLEEPPERTVFILDTDKPDLLLPTILSRGQKIRLSPMPSAGLVQLLKENHPQAEEEVLAEAAHMAAGCYVDALKLAAGSEWREAIKGMARVIFGPGETAVLASRSADFELAALWGKELTDLHLDEDKAGKMIARNKSDDEKGLRLRKRELGRQALILAYDRASRWALRDGPPPAGFADALASLKARINQNVDPALAQAAFELSL